MTDSPQPLSPADVAAVLSRHAGRPRVSREELDAQDRRREVAALVAALADNLGPRYSPERCSLDTFTVYDKAQQPVVARLREIAAGIGPYVGGCGNIFLYGPVGGGKDHLLAAMLYSAARAGKSCAWLNGLEFYARLRDGMDGSGKSEAGIFAELCRPAVLGISDPLPPAGDLRPWRLEQLYRLIDRRYRAMRPTWVTMNARNEQEADKALGQQAFDRLQETAEVLHCQWPSWRERQRRAR